MARQFQYAGDEWEAEGTGIGVGHTRGPTRWGVTFRCISDPSKGEHEGDIRYMDPNMVSEDELKAGLHRAFRKEDD